MRTKKLKKQPTRSKMVTGYIIYASEIRKEIIKQHPHKDFGEISKIVGVEWKNLAQESKVNYEKRAQEQNSLSKIQFMASAAAAAAVTTTTTTTTTTVNVVAAANGSHSMAGADDSLEKSAVNDNERQQLSQHHQQQQHHYSQQQAAYYSQLLDQATPILIRPTYQGGAPPPPVVAQQNSMPASNDALLYQQSQSQHSQQSQSRSPAQSSPPQQQPQQPYHQIFSHPQTQQMPPGQQHSQQSSPQLPYQLFQYPQQPTMVQYCNDPACCAGGRYQPYPYQFSPPAPATTPSSIQQQQQQQQHQGQQQQPLQSPQNSPPHDQYSLYKRNNIIYRKPSLVRLRPKDAATQTDPIAWIEKIDKMSPKKELRFSDKFIEHISSLGSNSPNKITDAAECH